MERTTAQSCKRMYRMCCIAFLKAKKEQTMPTENEVLFTWRAQHFHMLIWYNCRSFFLHLLCQICSYFIFCLLFFGISWELHTRQFWVMNKNNEMNGECMGCGMMMMMMIPDWWWTMRAANILEMKAFHGELLHTYTYSVPAHMTIYIIKFKFRERSNKTDVYVHE